MTNVTTVHTTDYLDASTMLSTGFFQYYNNNLEFFPTAEGYVKQTTLQGHMTFDYVFNYTDHLGNIRVSYTKDPHTGDIKILEENHYYPFGLKHQKYADFSGKIDAIDDETAKAVIPDDPNQNITPYRNYDYKYNGKELQDELGLNMYDMDMRMYDPAIARWVVMDPVVHHSMSPYNAFDDNPVFWADPSGAESESNSTSSDTGGEGTGITMMGIPLENMGVARIDVYGLGDGSQFKKNKNAFIDITKKNYNISEKQEDVGDWLYLNVDSIDEANALLESILGKDKLDNLVLDTHGGGEIYDDYGYIVRDALIAIDKEGGTITTGDLSKSEISKTQSLVKLISFVKKDGNFILASCYTGQSNLFGQLLHSLTGYKNNIYINNDFSSFHRYQDLNGNIYATQITGPITSIDDYTNGWDYFKSGDNSSTVNNVRNVTIKVNGTIKTKK